jgi:hypothetical protein
MLSVMTKTIGNLSVYPDNMLREIVDSMGTYASDEAKNFLAEHLGQRGIEADVAYRIVQLAAFNVLQPRGFWSAVRRASPENLDWADGLLLQAAEIPPRHSESIQSYIPAATLRATDELEATGADVERYNALLTELFADREVLDAWNHLFLPSHLLKEEHFLYETLLK